MSAFPFNKDALKKAPPVRQRLIRTSKDNNSTQAKQVFNSLFGKPKTMLQVEIETGVMRSNITWFVREWRKQNSIKIVRKGICPISKRGGVQYLTTNPELFPAIVKPSNTVKL
jgi:hypothetical protein